jgi:hypothetical protein
VIGGRSFARPDYCLRDTCKYGEKKTGEGPVADCCHLGEAGKIYLSLPTLWSRVECGAA